MCLGKALLPHKHCPRWWGREQEVTWKAPLIQGEEDAETEAERKERGSGPAGGQMWKHIPDGLRAAEMLA